MILIGALASFFIAALSGMGIGSGGFLVIYLSLAEQLPQLAAQGVNLLFFLFSSAASLLIHMRKRKLFGSVILVMSLAGIIGSPLGSLAASVLPSDTLRKIFGGMLILSGLLSLRKNFVTRQKDEKKKKSLAQK